MTPVTPKALTIRITYATAANLIVQVICDSFVPVSIRKDVVHFQGLWKITARVNFILFKVPATTIFIICRVYNLLFVLLTSKAATYVLPKAKFSRSVTSFQTWAKAGGCSKASFNLSAHGEDKAYHRYVQVIKQDKSIWNSICAW
jgi:hypothetical protein